MGPGDEKGEEDDEVVAAGKNVDIKDENVNSEDAGGSGSRGGGAERALFFFNDREEEAIRRVAVRRRLGESQK